MDQPTFIQHSGKGQSRIDYIFINSHLYASILSAKYNTIDLPYNSSSHIPLKLEIQVDIPSKPALYPKATSRKRLAWSRIDTPLYEETLQQYLSTSAPISDPDLAIRYLTKALTNTAKIAVPTIQKKVKKAPYNPTIGTLLKQARLCFSNWCRAGKPDQLHHTTVSRKVANKKLRAAQRQQNAINRNKGLDKLHNAAVDNPKLMFSIIKNQRSSRSLHTEELLFDGHVYKEDLLSIWKEHFNRLAIHQPDDHYTHHRHNTAIENIKILRELQEGTSLTVPITAAETRLSIRQLKNRKAVDTYNLQAEHMKVAPSPVVEFLTPVINSMLTSGTYPDSLKEGVKHPIPKKDKDISIPGNHRGISICPIIGKVVDKILLQHQKESTSNKFHPLQYGFSEGRSCTQAAFILSESIADAQDQKKTLYVAALDVQKAFDVVRHENLLSKLHQWGLQGLWWNLKDSAYFNMTERIMWRGCLSDKFNILQGSRQGAFPSPEDYISHLSSLLHIISRSANGFSIGGTNVTSPTCADDMIISSTSKLQLQCLLNLAAEYANEEHYNIHPQKTTIVPFNLQSSEQAQNLQDETPWSINDKAIPVEKEVTHLGIRRHADFPDATIEDRTKSFRRTFYSLYGAGLYGMSGLLVSACIKLYNAYVLPRGIFNGLTAIRISETGKSKLVTASQHALCCILGLPERTAIPALYILSGQLPITYLLDIRLLNFCLSLISSNPTDEIIIRQYVTKKNSSKSLVNIIKNRLYTYNLPTLFDLYINPPTKKAWKRMVKDAVVNLARRNIKEAAENKSSLRYLSKNFIQGQVHPLLDSVYNTRQVTRANIKTRIVCGVYPFNGAKHKMKKISSPICSLCNTGVEDLDHFMLHCSPLNPIRRKFQEKLDISLPKLSTISDLQAILDTRILAENCELPASQLTTIELISRDLCFALHMEKTKLQEDLARPIGRKSL